MLAVAYYCVLRAVCGRNIYSRKEHNKDRKQTFLLKTRLNAYCGFLYFEAK
jgi:hypothetical protein